MEDDEFYTIDVPAATFQQILDLIDTGGWAIGLKGDTKTIALDQPVRIVCSDYKVALTEG
jgi:hypothetical protein